MTDKHTPGPWQVEKGRDKTHPYSVTGDGFDLARCVTADDAALIAAAPDLVATLRALTDAVEQFTNLVADDWPEIATARALLAKLNEGKPL